MTKRYKIPANRQAILNNAAKEISQILSRVEKEIMDSPSQVPDCLLQSEMEDKQADLNSFAMNIFWQVGLGNTSLASALAYGPAEESLRSLMEDAESYWQQEENDFIGRELYGPKDESIVRPWDPVRPAETRSEIGVWEDDFNSGCWEKDHNDWECAQRADLWVGLGAEEYKQKPRKNLPMELLHKCMQKLEADCIRYNLVWLLERQRFWKHYKSQLLKGEEQSGQPEPFIYSPAMARLEREI